MKRIGVYLGLVFAACMAFFAVPASAEALAYGYSSARQMVAVNGPCDAGAQRLELTLAQWRQESQPGTEFPASNLLALSNHFGQSVAAPFNVPDWDVSITA